MVKYEAAAGMTGTVGAGDFNGVAQVIVQSKEVSQPQLAAEPTHHEPPYKRTTTLPSSEVTG